MLRRRRLRSIPTTSPSTTGPCTSNGSVVAAAALCGLGRMRFALRSGNIYRNMMTATAHSVDGALRHEIDVNGRHIIVTDEPQRLGGTDEGPTLTNCSQRCSQRAPRR